MRLQRRWSRGWSAFGSMEQIGFHLRSCPNIVVVAEERRVVSLSTGDACVLWRFWWRKHPSTAIGSLISSVSGWSSSSLYVVR